MMKILVTGAAGFIGYALAKRLLERGDVVIGVDNLNDYYDVNLKRARLTQLQTFAHFNNHQVDITNNKAVDALFDQHRFDAVVNLAAQAGVRYSIENPKAYIDSNLVGFSHVLEACRQAGVKHFVYASSSSVYGANKKMPFSESDNVDHPISLYAASKKANELIAHCYAHLYRLPCTGLRFFTVYGPWGRPDMALFKFTQGILAGEKIDVYNHGKMIRDFTYIDDIVEGVVRVIDKPAQAQKKNKIGDPSCSDAPYRIYNIGHGEPVELMRYIDVLESCLGKKAKFNYMQIQDGDVPKTCADITKLKEDFDYCPQTTVEQGIAEFVKWYHHYYSN